MFTSSTRKGKADTHVVHKTKHPTILVSKKGHSCMKCPHEGTALQCVNALIEVLETTSDHGRPARLPHEVNGHLREAGIHRPTPDVLRCGQDIVEKLERIIVRRGTGIPVAVAVAVQAGRFKVGVACRMAGALAKPFTLQDLADRPSFAGSPGPDADAEPAEARVARHDVRAPLQRPIAHEERQEGEKVAHLSAR